MQRSDVFEQWSIHRPKIISYIRNRIGKESDVEDISQEVFLKFWIENNEIHDNAKILNWLYSVTRFTIADFYRKKERMIPTYSISHEKAVEIDDATGDSNESKKLLPIIDSLPAKYKVALLMSDIYGLSHKKIAQQFELTVPCVKTRVVRARKLLAERMKECCSFSYDKYGNIVNCEERQAYLECLKKAKKGG